MHLLFLKLSATTKHLSLFALLMLCCQLVQATQTHFAQNNEVNQSSFSFAWKARDAEYSLDFSLNTQALNSMPSTKAAFSQAKLHREVEVALLRAAQALEPKAGRIKIKRIADRLEYQVSSRSQSKAEQIMQSLNTVKETAQKEYLDTHFYTQFTTNSGVSAIKHDHRRYAELSADSLTPVVDAIKNMQQNPRNPREFIEIALSWLQSIPYNTLEDRASSNGAGYLSPKDLLHRNQGDCDSKATLLAALMRAYAKSIRQVMVLLPQHALLAVAIPAQKNDKTIVHDGIPYVLLEAAGPAYFKAGKAAKTTLREIANKQYRIEVL